MTHPVIIAHYHLRRGGVTRVIETASACLREAGIDHLVLSGEPYDGSADLPVRVIDGLGYLADPGTLTAVTLADRLRHAAADVFGETPPLWHIHNHSLGKNKSQSKHICISHNSAHQEQSHNTTRPRIRQQNFLRIEMLQPKPPEARDTRRTIPQDHASFTALHTLYNITLSLLKNQRHCKLRKSQCHAGYAGDRLHTHNHQQYLAAQSLSQGQQS